MPGKSSHLLFVLTSAVHIGVTAMAQPPPVGMPPAVVPHDVPVGRGFNVKACGDYEPGGILSYTGYKNRRDQLRDEFALPKIKNLTDALDAEMTRALYEVLSNANDKRTKVIYSSYTHPGSRKKNLRGADELEDANQDAGEGLRVVFQRNVKAKDGTTRWISVILFFKHNEKTGRFELAGAGDKVQGDAIRVRAELAPPRKGELGNDLYNIAGLSYAVKTEGDRVTSIEPGHYQDEKGDIKREFTGVQHSGATPTSCETCHHPGAKSRLPNPRELDETDPLKTGSANRFLTKFTLEHQETPDKVTEMTKLLSSPRTTFVPKGLLDALKKRCQTLPASVPD